MHRHRRIAAEDEAEDEDDDFELVDANEVHSAMSESGPLSRSASGAATATITQLHWQKPTQHDRCRACGAGFDLIDRKHWCRRCGHIFCKKCASYERKLNANANPDPFAGLFMECHLPCWLCP